MPDDMDVAHSRDYKAKAAIETADRALEALNSCHEAFGRLAKQDREMIRELRANLRQRAAQIVRTWD